MARGKGEGSVFRVPKDRDKPLKYWQATFELPSHDGTRRRYPPIRSKDKKVVLRRLAEAQEQLRVRGDLPTENQSVAQWFEYWYREYVVGKMRPKTVASYRPIIFNHIIPVIGRVKIDKVAPLHIRKVEDRMLKELGLSSTYALNAHQVMSGAFDAAVNEGRVGTNPVRRSQAPLRAINPQEAFGVEEAIAVLEHVLKDDLRGARWATALLTGARRGEVLGLEYDRVTDVLDLSWQLQRLPFVDSTGSPVVPPNFEYRHLSGGLYLTRPKSRAGWRIIPLVEPLRSILQRHIENSAPNIHGLVFTNEGGRPMDPDLDTKRWKKVLAETGIRKNVVLHGLRHTAVDLLYLAGIPEDLIGEIVGHSSRSTTRGYKSRGSVNRVRLDDAMGRFSSLFTPAPLVIEVGDESDRLGE